MLILMRAGILFSEVVVVVVGVMVVAVVRVMSFLGVLLEMVILV